MPVDRFVLVPLDGAALSEGALPYASALASALGSGVRLLLVRPQRARTTVAEEAQTSPTAHADGDSRTYLEGVAARLRTGGLTVTATVGRGRPAEEILKAAEKPDMLLVVMATHGRGGVERWLEGSVADAVMRECGRPTLLVVPSDMPGGQQPVELQRILVPLDGSPLAEAALPLAEQVAAGCGASLTLVKALSLTADQSEAADIDGVKTYLEDTRTRLPASVSTETLVLLGLSPASLLARYAKGEGVDLVIMSTHGYGGLRRFTVGSVADHLVRSAVPALLVRPQSSDLSRTEVVSSEAGGLRALINGSGRC